MSNPLMETAQRERAELVRVRRELHRHPELALKEQRTAQVIERELDRLGVPHSRVGQTGVLGILYGREDSSNSGIVALRADIDALPIQERNEVEYRSEEAGVMHACGHDAHTACLIGAASLLQRERFKGEVRLIFQPAEETGGGASDFISSGALEGVRRVFGLHCAPELPVGTIGVKTGVNNAEVDHFRILVHGKSAHVSTPQLGADALYAASQIVTAIQGLVTRQISPVEPIILGIGKFQAGSAYNAVAEEAVLEGTTRTVSEETHTRIRTLIDQTAAQIAAVSGATAEVIWTGICAAVVNDGTACREISEAVRKLDTRLKLFHERPLALSGDNFSAFGRIVPGCYAYLGTSNPQRSDTHADLHNSCFDIDEDALPIGAALYTQAALCWLAEGKRTSREAQE